MSAQVMIFSKVARHRPARLCGRGRAVYNGSIERQVPNSVSVHGFGRFRRPYQAV